jgi:formate hydrogenlyase subunit 4
MLPPWGVQACQVLALLIFAPLISGVIAKAEARVQWRTGPWVLRPYYDILKLFRKESLRPESASPFFELAPLIAFAAYCSIALLIPVLTSFPLPLATAGDILGGALLFGLAGFVTALAGVNSGSVYAALGSSRTQSVATLVEPTLIFVFFTVALVTRTDLPDAMNATLAHSSSELRLFRIPDFMRAGFVLSVLAILVFYLANG